MNNEKIKNQYISNKVIVFILVIFCFVVIPASILSYSAYRYFKIDEEKIVLYLKSETQKMTNELRRNIQAEKYFCRFFHQYWLDNNNNPFSTVKNCINFCKNLKFRYGNDIDFVVVNNKGKVKYNTNPSFYNHTQKEWKNAYHFIREDQRFYTYLNNYFGKGDIKDVRAILGPQFVRKNADWLFSQTNYNLMWVDSSNRIPPSGVYPLSWGGIFVFISRKLLNDIKHIKYYVFDFAINKKIKTGIFKYNNIDSNFWCNKEIDNINEVKEALKNSEKQAKNILITDNFYILHQFIDKDVRVFSFIEKKNTDFDIVLKYLLIFVSYFLLSYPIIKYFWNTIILNIPGTASIRLKLAFLFLYASGIPLLTLAVIDHEYKLHKRLALIEEARLWSVENLLGLEQRYLSYIKKMCNDLDKYVANLTEKLKEKGLNRENALNFRDEAEYYKCSNYYLIASNAPLIATDEGLLKYEGSLDNLNLEKYKIKSGSYRCNEITLFNIIVKKLSSDLNGVEIPNATLSKLELLAESMIQKKFSEIIYTIVEALGFIKEWGFMNIVNLTYFKFISLNKKEITDYVVMMSWRPRKIQDKFIEDIIPKANRNPKNFKFIAYERYENQLSPKQYKDNKQIELFAKRAGEKPTEEIETINLDGEEYIAVSFLGRNSDRYSFVGLYPIKNIDLQINQQSFILGLLGCLCLILSLGLAQLLSKSFIKPLQTLQDGALAIENRNFKYRLSGLNIDEFGEVGSIFNRVMVGLEELEVAKIVQESMFPKPEFNQGNFSIYCKPATMIDVGGDYFDYFKVDDNSFAVLVGDVAGHGVGAAVIMAMAKAAILGAGECLKTPAELLNYLHKMILSTKKPKQKKIMTFQYLYINSDTGDNIYANAGACSPLLVRKSENTIEEIKMISPVLGGFKKSSYKEMKLDLQPGDSIVFYTDGIIESKNKNGEVLGYERFKEIVLNSWNENPETYYNNIFINYQKYIGPDSERSDDLTVVILTYNKPVYDLS